jgi:cell division protein FtsZ
MIEFNADGPFSGKADPLFPDRVRIIGLGQTGAAVCDQIVLHGRPGQDVWVFDSDQQTIEGSIVPNRHLLGQETVHGLGCSGDIDLAREIVSQEAHRLADVVHGCDFLILIVGLGGSTGMALAEHLTQLGRRAGAKVIVVGVQPFAFEGSGRRERSVEAIATLRSEADSVLVLSYDRLNNNPAAPKNIRHSFHLMHQLLAQAAQALAQVVCKRGLIQLSFADVRSLYGRYTGAEALENCWVAHVEGDIHDSIDDLMQRLLDGPLLADESIWKHIDHAIVAVSGTRDLGLSDVQEMVGAFKERLKTDIPIATSASLDDDNHERLRMTVLFAMTAPVQVGVEETPAPAKKKTPAAPVRLLGDTVPLPGVPATEKPAKATVKAVPAKAAKPTRTATPVQPAPIKPAPLPEPEPILAHEEILEEEEEITPFTFETGPLASAESQPGRRTNAKQEEMVFEGATRGRFEKTHETIYRGENLDQPTFRRRALKIRL